MQAVSIILIILILLAPLPIWLIWQMNRVDKAEHWPKTVGTIQSAEIEFIKHVRHIDIYLPVCAYSYKVGEEYYSGRFSLIPNTVSADEVVKTVVNQTIPVHYNPKRPEVSHIPLQQFAGCDIDQKIAVHFGSVEPR